MKQFIATVRATGLVVKTIVFADNTNQATHLLQAQYGAKNLLSTPIQLN